MKKSLHTPELRIVIRLLTEARHAAKLQQKEVAQRIEKPPSFVSRVESGETVLDLLETRQYLMAINLTLPEFVQKLEQELIRLGIS